MTSEQSAGELSLWIKERALALGFSSAGCCAAAPSTSWNRFIEWLDAGYAGEMHYLTERRDAYRHPDSVLNGVRSIVMLTLNYRTREPAPSGAGFGRVSRYAWGAADYHDVARDRLRLLAADVLERRPDAKVRGVVDTAPLMERDLARQAGLGWIGKNTLLLNRQQGSWFFLAALLLDVELDEDAPFEADHCGTCRACLDACPTQAFAEAYVLDATKCISYLTIELHGQVSRTLRGGLGDWVFGCDICQEVCPWNRRAGRAVAVPFEPRDDLDPLALCELFDLSDETFRERFRRSPMRRAKRRGLLRSAAIVLGNQLGTSRGDRGERNRPLIEALRKGLRDIEPTVRGACVWALGQCADECARQWVADHLKAEQDPLVMLECRETGTVRPTSAEPR